MIQREAFFHFLQPQYLYNAAIVFAVLTSILVAVIYIYLFLKKRSFLVVSRIDDQVNTWLGQILMDKERPDIDLSPELQEYLKKPRNREFVIDNLIKIRKNLRGAAAKSLVELYENLGLKKDSIRRFNSVVWHQKAKGIYELYMMDQEQELPDIYKYTNSANEYVRMEAQIAIVGFWGFRGLSFLDSLEYPLTEWQQLKLLEQLSTLDTVAMDQLPDWLRSDNEYVVHFALKLADIYREMDVHDIVVECLQSHNAKLRFQAIKTLGRIARAETGAILTGGYDSESEENKKAILQQLEIMDDLAFVPFLESVITSGDDLLKLEAARALTAISNGADVLTAYASDATMASIRKQVQYELSR